MKLKTFIVFALAFVFTVAALPAHAAKVEGVTLPDTIEVGKTTLNLNGAGVRTKFFMDIYVGALYLPQKATDAKSAIAMDGPKRVHLHFVYKNVSKKKATNAWREGFQDNLSKAEHEAIAKRIERFCDIFNDTKSGETYSFDYLPGMGTQVYHNGQLKDTIEGEDFMRGLLLIWIGDQPAHTGLRSYMLGRVR